MEYDFRSIERKWQEWWISHKTYQVGEDASRPKYYVLDMFPYPSGAGLHVGHPLGYIASDIFSRYKRLKGQYAIQTGRHPETTTTENIARYRSQLDRIGFSYDWSREVRTCDPAYYKWTQWAFLKMFGCWYDRGADKARPIEELVAAFEKGGSAAVDASCGEVAPFTAGQWKAFSEKEKSDILMQYRIAYQGETSVNWCEGLGTVLANDEVKEGLSVRGGFPVEQKKMKQWQLRVSAYAGRLLEGLDRLDWTDSLKEMQRNWIGKSEGTEVVFKVNNGSETYDMTIFTTRVDTIFGVTFMVLAPESDWVEKLTTPAQKAEVNEYRIPGLCEEENGTGAHRRDAYRDGRFLGLLCRESAHGRECPGLDFRICAGRLRYGSHHGGSRPRQPRLCLCPQIQPAHRAHHRGLRRQRAEL